MIIIHICPMLPTTSDLVLVCIILAINCSSYVATAAALATAIQQH